MNKLIALAAATVLSAVGAQANATVTWTFIETSCIAQFGPCPALMSSVTLPFAGLATLTLPGPTSSGTAFWFGAPGVPVYTGDAFLFQSIGSDPVSPAFTGTPSCQFGGGHTSLCTFDISWSETAGNLDSVSIELNSFANTIGYSGPFGLNGGQIASDGPGFLGGCAFQSGPCRVTGFWQSDLPKPMSVSLLLSGLLGLWLVWRFRRCDPEGA